MPTKRNDQWTNGTSRHQKIETNAIEGNWLERKKTNKPNTVVIKANAMASSGSFFFVCFFVKNNTHTHTHTHNPNEYRHGSTKKRKKGRWRKRRRGRGLSGGGVVEQSPRLRRLRRSFLVCFCLFVFLFFSSSFSVLPRAIRRIFFFLLRRRDSFFFFFILLLFRLHFFFLFFLAQAADDGIRIRNQTIAKERERERESTTAIYGNGAGLGGGGRG